MAKAQFKLLIFLITVGLFAGVIATGYWIFENVMLHEHRVEKDLAAMKGKDRPKVDPGARRFDAAIEQIKGGSITEGRDLLYKLLVQFPDSATCPEARRIIGEINMDQLFSPSYTAGKAQHIVQPGENLGRIADKYHTNIDFIIRLNAMMSTTLQPGDRLTVAPIEFNLEINAPKKRVTLRRKIGDKDYEFKFYNAQDIVLPPGTKILTEYEIGNKTAQIDGKAIPSTDPRYMDAEKWIPSTKPGLTFRLPPVPKATAVVEAPAGSTTAPALAPPPETGIFLDHQDLEEIFSLIRKGSKLVLTR